MDNNAVIYVLRVAESALAIDSREHAGDHKDNLSHSSKLTVREKPLGPLRLSWLRAVPG